MNVFCPSQDAFNNLNTNEIYKAYDSGLKISMKKSSQRGTR